ncbi:MAG: hypothetical protein AMXMBFR37_10060 [Steroidobacteraceae bacterium]
MSTPIHAKFQSACYAVICRDGPDGAAKRAAAMEAHLRHIERIIDEIRVAGPLYDHSGTRQTGSVLIFRTQSAERARELTEADPLFEAGVWDSIEVLPFLPAAGTYIGGTTW